MLNIFLKTDINFKATGSSNSDVTKGVHVSAGSKANGPARVDDWQWEELEWRLAVEEREKENTTERGGANGKGRENVP